MTSIRMELVNAALKRADVLLDYDICETIEKRYEFRRQTILADESLTKDEKLNAIKRLNKKCDRNKVLHDEGKKRICENCYLECLATLYCELCIRNYLKAKFTSWTSGNDNVDILIQKCQMEAIAPNNIIEWIPYDNLQNIKYLTKGGCSEIYTSEWIGGNYFEWDSKKQQLRRYGTENVILKKLKNVKSANRSWFDEAKSHLTICNKWPEIVKCFGLSLDPSNGNYMLVMNSLDMNLRKYLQQNHNQLTWKNRIKVSYDIIKALNKICIENAIHRDLHSGNILYSQSNDRWYISDLGFCGPADKPLGCIYGNLPYIAPEIIVGKEYTYASDIYSIGILMWEISSGQPPFSDHDEYDLAINIINGMKPKSISGIPLEYKNLMEHCWNTDPTKRPDIFRLRKEMRIIRNSYYQNENNNQQIDNIAINTLQSKTNSSSINSNSNSTTNSLFRLSSKFSTSKIYNFKRLLNDTKEEQEAFHNSKLNILNNSTILIEENNEGNNKLKRSFSNNSDEDEKEDSVNKPKKMKLEDNEDYHSRQYDFDI